MDAYPELKPFLLSNVKVTGTTIGAGSYGSVEEVEVSGDVCAAVCAAKQIHSFFQDPTKVRAADIRRASVQFVTECQLMSTLCHPNIVKFLGVCALPGSKLPGLVMERLETSFHDSLDPEVDPPPPEDAPKPFFPLDLKCSILQNVASGLTYLHEKSIIHRDLSARNVLLTSGLVAKIADLGMARIITHVKSAVTMTKAPGSTIYMPPEALENKPGDTKAKYDSSIDVFSFGVLSIFTLSQTFPCNLLAPTYREGVFHMARTELQRREQYMKMIYSQFHNKHALVQLIEKCLDFPEQRPSIHEVMDILKEARAENKQKGRDMNMLDLLQAFQSEAKDKDHDLASMKKESRHQQQYLETLKKQQRDLAQDVETARVAAACYKEDFEKERSDRARAAGKIDSLERTAVENARGLAEKFQNESSEMKVRLEQAAEELRVKAAQVKNYKKQVDSLQAELKKKQQEELVVVTEPYLPVEPVDVNSGLRLMRKDNTPRFNVFRRKSRTREEPGPVGTEEKDRMKAIKRERERTVKRKKEERKATMDKMDDNKLKVFLESEINRLEHENMILKNQLECSEATIKCLVDKLQQTEALVVKATGSSPAARPSTVEGRKVGDRQGDPRHRGSSTDRPGGPHTQQQRSHEGLHHQVQRRVSSSTESSEADQRRDLDPRGLRSLTSDPRFFSKKDDYVNVPPGSKSMPKAQSPVEGPRLRKSPIPTPRSVSLDPSRRAGGLGVPDTHEEQSVSMPAMMGGDLEQEDRDISSGLDEDIHSRALEVVGLGRVERKYTLTSIPFDPFLECLFCNQRFRYGKIQKYRKHVNDCTGSTV